ncbi:MAG: SIS domain-containing protein [Acidobacteria bacterium]|nr:SIS domain-containing protein [Acidobacteriota bacterium]
MTAVSRSLRGSADALASALSNPGFVESVERVAEMMVGVLRQGGKVLVFGNGGSAADAQHLAAELVGRYRRARRGLPAIALTTDSSALTSIGNDFGFDRVFARQLEALGAAGDMALAISTSGGSANVLAAVEAARRLGLAVVGLTGGGGGRLARGVDIAMVVPSDVTARIQECHIAVIHALCEAVDAAFAEA